MSVVRLLGGAPFGARHTKRGDRLRISIEDRGDSRCRPDDVKRHGSQGCHVINETSGMAAALSN
jgi:hypothetical protein